MAADPGPEPDRARPFVSVVIPTHDRADVLPRAVRSVLGQTCSDLELIVVDDGATTAPAALDTVADPRLAWVPTPHLGVSGARNLGIARARGEWVAFLDDDNEWLPTYLERQLATAQSAAADVVSALATEVGADGARRRQVGPPSPDVVRAFAEGWSPFTSAVMVRRTALLAAGGFPPHLTHSEDRHLWIRLALDRRWALTPDALMLRNRGVHVHLSDDLDAVRAANAELERTYGREMARRVGLRSGMRFFWHYRGRSVTRDMLQRAPSEGRRAAWDALSTLARAFPRSASALVRPITLLAFGRGGYAWLHHRYTQGVHGLSGHHRR